MSMRASWRKLLALEAYVGRVLEDCRERAWQRLSYAEQEQLLSLFAAHRPQVVALEAQRITHMACPDWVTPAQWASLQRYDLFYGQEYDKRVGQYEAHPL